ncbi:MAG: MCE family protein [Propionibacteriales bacterium]|nr:MCE family protein [Propionibacteriales bacterium]
MISRTTKLQLMVFVLITLIGVSYVGAKYARLDRLVLDTDYTVSANFAESAGIFDGAEVTYRGVGVGRVDKMRLSEDGVFVDLAIENDTDSIPSDVVAVVANKSALGEQYVDLQPKRDSAPPYLEDGSDIKRADTRTPISTPEMLVDIDRLVDSVDKQDLQTVVDELGLAFDGTGDDLGRIIDTSNSFIDTADDNLDLTRRLLADGEGVLQTQVDSAEHIRTFAKNLRLLSDTLVDSDATVRSVIDDGAVAARDLRDFIAENADTLSVLISNLVTTGEITVARLDGLEQVLVLYPYVVEGSFSVAAKDKVTGLHDAHFGLILTADPHVCEGGYETTKEREPQDLSEVPFNTAAHCAEPQSKSNPRGAQHAPPAKNRAPVVAQYDLSTKTVSPATGDVEEVVTSADAAKIAGEESWKWMLLAPLADRS